MYEDKTLVCKECGQEFVFTAGEQEFYAERGFQNEPQRCKACRDARKNAARGPREYFTAVCAPGGRAAPGPGGGVFSESRFTDPAAAPCAADFFAKNRAPQKRAVRRSRPRPLKPFFEHSSCTKSPFGEHRGRKMQKRATHSRARKGYPQKKNSNIRKTCAPYLPRALFSLPVTTFRRTKKVTFLLGQERRQQKSCGHFSANSSTKRASVRRKYEKNKLLRDKICK